MEKLTRDDLLSLEQYADKRMEFRQRVLGHKRDRKLPIGPNVTLLFEDRLTIQYQIQEMLRVERIFEAAGIQEELDAYNPLIPDGQNWKATMLIEFPDVDERRVALKQLVGIERQVWVQATGCDRIIAVADEDLERATPEKTSAVHFLRFDLDDESVQALKSGASIGAGIDHPEYGYTVGPVLENLRRSLLADLE
ncbi:MAG TPA: DUF3501 family protein [Gammaproteobacteria bacterium]|nr:DUF3501 family protein [Gammaproteobacteria bacterium]